MKEIEKELASVRSASALASIGDLSSKSKKLGEITFTGAKIADGVSGEDLRKIALDLRARDASSVVALISIVDAKPVLVVAVSDSAKLLGAKAGALVKVGSSVLGGGGGGKDDFAQGGGVDGSKSSNAIDAIEKAIVGL